jgi:CRP/FNR family transcriptional regulator, cyclic AMP receptor protein
LDEADLSELGMIMNYAFAKKNEEIYFNINNRRIYLIVKGSFKIVTEDAYGQELVTEILEEGDLFGALLLSDSFKEDDQHQKAVVASNDINFCSFLASDFESLLEKKPSLSIHYTKWVGFWYKKMSRRFQDILYKDVKTRLIDFLEDWALKSNGEQNEVWKIKNFLTQKDIAQIIGASRQTVATLFTELANEGYISYNRNEINILKPRKYKVR